MLQLVFTILYTVTEGREGVEGEGREGVEGEGREGVEE